MSKYFFLIVSFPFPFWPRAPSLQVLHCFRITTAAKHKPNSPVMRIICILFSPQQHLEPVVSFIFPSLVSCFLKKKYYLYFTPSAKSAHYTRYQDGPNIIDVAEIINYHLSRLSKGGPNSQARFLHFHPIYTLLLFLFFLFLFLPCLFSSFPSNAFCFGLFPLLFFIISVHVPHCELLVLRMTDVASAAVIPPPPKSVGRVLANLQYVQPSILFGMNI